MKIKKYIELHYNELKRKVKAVTRNHQNSDDLLNDCILSLLEKGNDFCQQLLVDDKVQQFIIKSAYIQYNSATSPFYTNYKKDMLNKSYLDENYLTDIEDKIEEKEDKEKLTKDIKLYISNLPFYEKEIATKHFIEGNSQRQMSKQYNINRIHISKDISKIKSNLHLSFNRDKYKTR
jgi:RNA polymerase sigma factor (sigma-70 family)